MPISVSCPGCSAKLNAPDAAAGKKVKCPKCQALLQVPQPGPVVPEFEVVPDAEEPTPKKLGRAPTTTGRRQAPVDVDDDEDRPEKRPAKKSSRAADDGEDERPTRKKKKKAADGSTSLARNVVMGVVLIALVAVAGVVFYNKFGKKDDTAANPPSGDAPPVLPTVVPPDKKPKPSGPGAKLDPTKWESDPRLSDRLGPYQDVAGYQIRPPKGYNLVPVPAGAPKGVQMFGWVAPPRANGVIASLTLGVFDPPPGEPDRTDQQFLSLMLDGVARRRTNFESSPPENGDVGGMTLVRVRWSGTDKDGKLGLLRGFMYAGKFGRQYVQLASQDVDPGGEADLVLAEAAALTLRKK